MRAVCLYRARLPYPGPIRIEPRRTKLKAPLDSGVLTQDEFDTQKKKILQNIYPGGFVQW